MKLSEMLAPESGAHAAAALAPLVGSDFPAQVQLGPRATDDGADARPALRASSSASATRGDLRLKLAVARRMLLLAGRRYRPRPTSM